jgi:hypothetical protein
MADTQQIPIEWKEKEEADFSRKYSLYGHYSKLLIFV